jgi:hypothetical protein
MMKIAENVNVYWSSLHEKVEFDNLYNLFDTHYQNISKINPRQNLLLCPAVSHKLKNTFFVKTPIDCEYSIKDNQIVPLTKDFIATETPHQPSLQDNFLFCLGLYYIFFTRLDMNMTLTSPFFSQCYYTRYANIVPGTLNVSKWFRRINLEFNCYGDTIKFKKGDPLAYFTFDTDKRVNLKRFHMSKKLDTLSSTCEKSSGWEKWVPLYNRYKRFIKSRTDKIVYREIQKNLL